MFRCIVLFIFCVSCVQAFALDANINLFRSHSKQDVQNYVESQSLGYEEWSRVEALSHTDFYCLGETHKDKFRDLYADLIPKLKPSVLFLESVPSKINDLITGSHSGEEVKMLNARVDNVINASLKINAQLNIVGIEQTQEQDNLEYEEEKNIGRSRKTVSRESFIALNAAKNIQKDKINVALYGALHCSKNDLKLPFTKSFFRLLKEAYPELKMKSVYVAFASDLNDFVKILMGYQLHEKSFVIADTSKIESEKINHKDVFKKYLDNYDVIIYVNDR